jgi:excinuclease ABC subunit C
VSDALDTVAPELREVLDRIPAEPGVYLMKDKKGRVVYVGKAASLRQRVRSYFTRSGDARAFVALLGRMLGDIETVVTNNEKEALLLENNLIKQHQPRFNVKLVDDKNYLVLRLDTAARYPRLEVVRRLGSDGARYFGPYHSATSCRQTLQVVNRHFKLRTCSDQVLESRARPCLQYQIKRCDAPCVFDVPVEQYADQVRDVCLFLEGKDSELIARLRARMKDAASQQAYEVAASVRDQITSLEKTLTEQRVVSAEQRDQDVVGFHREGGNVEIAVLYLRQGKLLGRRTFSFVGQEFPDEEIVSSFVSLYYDLGSFVPDEVLLPCSIEDAAVKAEWLRERRAQAAEGERRGGRAVEVLAPQRGPRARLVELANKNAASSFASRRDRGRDAEESLARLQERLGLKRLPRRIECFDVSHIQGAATVASMVVFTDGEPDKKEYRHFKVKSVTNDDFAAMYEVLARRFRRSVKQAEAGERRWPLPDLLVVDGGKGQLATALAALRDSGVDLGHAGIDVVGLAKESVDGRPTHNRDGATRKGGDAATHKPDRVFLPRLKDPVPLRPNSAELFVLSRIRDEAHRFAVTFHRSLRGRRTLRSALGDVPGVGAKRQRELLRRFGSVRRVAEATVDELAAAPGMTRTAAEAVHRFLRGQPIEPAAATPSPPPPTRQRAPRRSTAHDREDVLEDEAAEELSRIAEDTPSVEESAPGGAMTPVEETPPVEEPGA